jgi:HEPN domain-containing protein
MNRADFRRLAGMRLREAQILLKNRQYSGAYYLCGYAVECALKACIAKRTGRYEFPPDRRTVERLYSHDLAGLAIEAGLDDLIRSNGTAHPDFLNNWAITKNWSEQARCVTWSAADAKDLLSSVSEPNHGVLKWLEQHW